MDQGGELCTCTAPRQEVANSEKRGGGPAQPPPRFPPPPTSSPTPPPVPPSSRRRLVPSHQRPQPIGQPRGEHPQHQMNHEAPEGEPEQHHDQADRESEQPAQKPERQERHDGDAGESDQTPDHGILPSCESRTNNAAGGQRSPVRGTFQKVSSEPAWRQRLTSWWWAAGWWARRAPVSSRWAAGGFASSSAGARPERPGAPPPACWLRRSRSRSEEHTSE